jgi:hypothetical protein
MESAPKREGASNTFLASAKLNGTVASTNIAWASCHARMASIGGIVRLKYYTFLKK